MPLRNGSLQSIAKLVNDGSNFVLDELDRVQQKFVIVLIKRIRR